MLLACAETPPLKMTSSCHDDSSTEQLPAAADDPTVSLFLHFIPKKLVWTTAELTQKPAAGRYQGGDIHTGRRHCHADAGHDCHRLCPAVHCKLNT